MSNNNPFAAGASASLNRTISEISRLLKGKKMSVAGPLRTKMRASILRAITTNAERWYKRGFNRGHIESYVQFRINEEVPRKLTKSIIRELPPNNEQKIKLKSTIGPKVHSRVRKGLK